jgi:predicted amidohydrolase YtcJ
MPDADLILNNANVITMDPAHPTAGLVAIKGNKIWLVADSDRLGEVKGGKAKIIDCWGRTVVP